MPVANSSPAAPPPTTTRRCEVCPGAFIPITLRSCANRVLPVDTGSPLADRHPPTVEGPVEAPLNTLAVARSQTTRFRCHTVASVRASDRLHARQGLAL